MATFGSRPPEELGEVVRHFGVPMYPYVEFNNTKPHREYTPPGYVARDHVHPCPRPWKHPKQLIIAFPYRSPSAILATWPMPRKTPNSRNHPPSKDSVSKTCEKPLNLPQYWLDDETHAWLIKQCGERLESWAKMCFEDPGFCTPMCR